MAEEKESNSVPLSQDDPEDPAKAPLTSSNSSPCEITSTHHSRREVLKEMPCGHGHHGDCIVPWLAARNSCLVCQFALLIDDADYEEERKKRIPGGSSSRGSGAASV